MRADVLNTNSGSLALPPSKGVIKVESKLVPFAASSANIDSGAMSVPANSIITKLTAVVHTALAHASGNIGVSVGTAAGGTQFTGTLDADVLTAALGGTAIMGTLAASYRSADTDVHFRAVSSGGNFTAGTMCYIIEYIELLPQ